MSEFTNQKEHWVQLPSHELLRIRALCDEIMESLCQAKALLEPVYEDDFFSRLNSEILRHYFYALDTIIEGALEAKDEIYHVVNEWEKEKSD